MNYYERHLGDYARDTGHLSLIEHGVYTLLLDRYYATEKPIPSNQAYRMARARTRAEKRAVDAVLEEYFILQDGLYHNARADAEIERKNIRSTANQENGKKGGRPKTKDEPKDTPEETKGKPEENPEETQEKPNWNPTITQPEPNNNPNERHPVTSSPVTSNQKPEGKAYATGQSPVAPRAQAHATQPAKPPVETEKKPEGLAEQQIAEPKKTEPVAEAKPDKPPNAARKKSDTADLVLGVDDIVADGVELQNARQWLLVVRKDKRARLTPRAWNYVKEQALKAGISIDRAVQTSVERNWQGFEADWYARLQNQTTLARASPYPENVPDGAIPLVRGATMQSAELAKQLIFSAHVPPENREKSHAAV